MCLVSVNAEKSKDPSQKLISDSDPVPGFDGLSLKENYDPESDIYENESSLSLSESAEEYQAWVSLALKPKKQLHKRKGVPRRAPLL
ncbi:unnamed protein product [Ilex paraguariensis]|uniref:Uncharacterized protein n=1 Tax=Ilex paraguariensis TaxID=185542 RepID=A0ABC8S0Z4_9AQUA